MKRSNLIIRVIAIAVVLAESFSLPAAAEVVYTSAAVSIPAGSYYQLDLNHDGVTDFTLRSALLQDYCQFGDGYVWSLTVTPADGSAAITTKSSSNASALLNGMPINSVEKFHQSSATMAELSWGTCGTRMLGEWLNLPNRYLGLQFRGSDKQIHYAWAKLNTVAYIDQHGHLQATTILSGFAYETVPRQPILTGQTSDAP
jgi:hypothetical protein